MREAGRIGKSKTIAGQYVAMWGRTYQTWWGSHHPTLEIGCSLGVWGGASKLWIDITSAVWQLGTHCLILGVFEINLSDDDIAEIEGLKDVAMETNFGTTLAANGLWREMGTWGFRIKDGLFSVNSASVGRPLWIRSCGVRNCSRQATVRLGIGTLIANILVGNYVFVFEA